MKIDRLELRAFGPFTDKVLDLSAGELGLHVVHGPNEAGKSSALRALHAALYGIPARTSDDFLHAYGKLRLGLRLRSGAGDVLECVRRKANKDALRDAADDAALDEAALQRMLGGVGRDEFLRVFGLDHRRLDAGGKALLDQSGAAALTVGAGLGTVGLRGVAQSLADAAGLLYADRGKNPAVNAGLRELTELRKRQRAAELSVTEWQEAERMVRERVAERDAAQQEVDRLQGELSELQAVQRDRGAIARRRDLAARLAELDGVPDLAEDFEARRRDAEARCSSAQTAIARSETRLEAAQARLEQLPEAAPLLGHADTIEELGRLAADPHSSSQHLERLQQELEMAAQGVASRATALGIELVVGDESAVGPLRAVLAGKVESLTAELTAELVRRDAAAEALRKAEQRCARAAEELQAHPAPASSTALDEAVAAAQRVVESERDLAKPRAELQTLRDRIAAALAALPGFSGDAEGLRRGRVPGAQIRDDFARRFQDLQRDADDLERDREAAEQGCRDAEASIEQLAVAEQVPDESELLQVRGRRDAQWRLVRRAWLDGEEVAGEAAELDPERPLAEAFEFAVHSGDRIGDRLREASDRVARLVEARDRLREHRVQLENCVDRKERLDARRAALDAEWQSAWQDAGLQVGTPASMADLMQQRERILEQDDRRAALALEIEQIEARLAAATTGLRDVLGETDQLPLATLLARAEQRQQDRVGQERAHREAAQQQRSALRQQQDCADDLAAREQQVAERQADFAAAVRELPGGADLQPDDAPGRLRQVRELVAAFDAHQGLRSQAAEAMAGAELLAGRVAEFCAAHAADIDEQSPQVAATALRDRLKEQQRLDAERSAAITERDAARTAYDGDQQQLLEATAELQRLVRDAGASGVDALAARVQEAARKRGLREDLAGCERELQETGEALADLEARIERHRGVDVDAAVRRLETELPAARELAQQRHDAARDAERHRDDLRGRQGAAELAAEIASRSAGVVADVERHLQLHAASLLLRRAVERVRQSREAPLLRAAAAHFERLTRGRYDRIETEVTDDGTAFFQVREVTTGSYKNTLSLSKDDDDPRSALSEGTRCQLYLALVLGSLEERFKGGAEALPLVLDDVLVHFDDARSAAALQAFAEFASHTQVLLFTHHDHVRDQALALGEAAGVFVHEL